MQSPRIVLTLMILLSCCAACAAQCCATQSAKDGCNYGTGGRCHWDDSLCTCVCTGSPIILDLDGKGFHLTSPNEGVLFDLTGVGVKEKVSWTEAGSNNAFLVLDRDHDGNIDNGLELFGDHTAQPPSDHPNGFLALEQFDMPELGGNMDGLIDEHDAVFSSLRLWIDANHDGVAQPNELSSLPALGVISINVEEVTILNRKDKYGNLYRYRAEVNNGALHGSRWAYDVYLASD